MISNIYTLSDLQNLIDLHPADWRPLVLTNGCFDLLHAGHVRYLQAAKSLGHRLVVGVNSDHSVQIIKPPESAQVVRPIIPQNQRAEVLAALKAVDAIVIFDQLTADVLIEALKPDIYVKGGDYNLDSLPETPSVQAYGGQIKFIEVEVPSSTTAIIEKILQANIGSLPVNFYL